MNIYQYLILHKGRRELYLVLIGGGAQILVLREI
jgi:hypothetical protein